MNQLFSVQGMTCAHCERAITQAIQALDPLAQVQIDRHAGTVRVQTDQDRQAIAQAIANEGYELA